jgi:hypothetical protein
VWVPDEWCSLVCDIFQMAVKEQVSRFGVIQLCAIVKYSDSDKTSTTHQQAANVQ